MSAETIARWNAIPMVRDDHPSQQLKRSRSQDSEKGDTDESDDDISLISRSPSPQDSSRMDIDKYDEYHEGSTREVITTETKLKSSNKGFAMLANMGWVEGQPLGLSGDGRVDPVPFYVKNDLTGLGKSSQDVRMIETTVSQRRELHSEKQVKETDEQRKAREDSVAKKAAVQSEILSALKAFYCELCDKQFKNVAQYDEHTNSYAHHHKARFRDMQAAQRASRNTQEELDKRKEKERKREEKELRKIAKAAGIKMAKPPVSLTPAVHVESTAYDDTDTQVKPGGFKRSGWATVGQGPNLTAPDVPLATAAQKTGWATVGPASTSAVAAASSTVVKSRSPAAPSFRTGGWTSLDTGSSAPAPHYAPAPAPPPTAPPPVPPSDLPPARFLALPPTPSPPSQDSTLAYRRDTNERPSYATVSNTSRTWNPISSPATPPINSFPVSSPSPSQPLTQATPQNMPPAPPRQEASRSGWQNFKASSRRK